MKGLVMGQDVAFCHISLFKTVQHFNVIAFFGVSESFDTLSKKAKPDFLIGKLNPFFAGMFIYLLFHDIEQGACTFFDVQAPLNISMRLDVYITITMSNLSLDGSLRHFNSRLIF